MKSVLTLVCAMILSSEAWALQFDSNVPKDIQTQMTEDLKFMSELKGTEQTPFHKEIFTALDGAGYKTFFESRVLSVGLHKCGGGNAVACVIPLFYPTKMWLTENFIKFSHPQISRMMVVFHEARHTEKKSGNWMHDNCPTPFLDADGKEKVSIWTGAKLAGEAACDASPYGSYGSSTILLKNVAKFCTNCTDKVKMDADLYAMDQLGHISKADAAAAMLKDFAHGTH